MNCFRHTTESAVGICKACNKGLCEECAVDVGNGLACQGPCEDEVKSINRLISQNKNTMTKSEKLVDAASPGAGVLFSLAAGLLFLFLGLSSEKIRLISLLGVLFIAQGAFSAYRLWFRKGPENPSNDT